MADRRKHVVLLGGGACGMAAALELVNAGARVTVLEREPRVGGLCGTHEREGFRFDFGGHRFVTQNAQLDGLVRELLGEDLLERQRSSIVLNGGKRYRYPLELDDVLRQYGVTRGLRAVGSYLRAATGQRLRPRRETTFEEWVTHRFGQELYRTFFGPYTEKLWGIPPSAISADWAAQRISLPSLADVGWRLAGARRPAARTYARRYRYPRLGIGQIFERMAAAIALRGGVIETGAEVTGLVRVGGVVRAVEYRTDAGPQSVDCDALISSISLPTLAGFLGPMSPAVARSAERLRFRAIRLVNLLLDGPQVSPHTWMYVSEPGYAMARIQEPNHRSPAMSPPGATSLMLEVPCSEGDPTWTAPEAALYERCLADLERLGFGGLRSRTRGYFSSYVREGYPIYHLGYDSDRRALLGQVEKTPNVVSCGRQGAFRYIFMDTAMEMGMAAARAVLAPSLPRGHISELGGARELLEAKALTA